MPRKNTSSADYPRAVLQQIEQLAQNITIARKRRGESQAQWARKLGISQPTMARIERGDPSVAMASYVMCMWLINQAAGLAELIAPQNDHAALEKEVAKVRTQRKSSKQVSPNPSPLNLETSPTPSRSATIEESPNSAPPFNTHDSKSSATKPAKLARRLTEPMDAVRKSLVRTTQLSELARPSAAMGLAALLAGSDPK